MGGSSSSSNQQSQSYNQAYPTISSAFSSLLPVTSNATSAISALLNGDSSGFDTFKKIAGFDAATQQGSQGITGNAAASGVLNSGGTAKALQSYGQAQNQQYYQNYIQNLLGLSGIGLSAGGVLSSAGNTANSQGSSSGKSMQLK